MPLDPQCNSALPGCNDEFTGEELKVQDGCPQLCFSIYRRSYTDEDGKVYSGVCDGDVQDLLDGATGEVSVYTLIKIGDDMLAGSFLGYQENTGLLVLLTDNDFQKVLPGDIIEGCRDTQSELLRVTEIGLDKVVVVERGYNGTEQMDWKGRETVRLYRIFRGDGTINPEEGTLCYQWTRTATSTPGSFGAYAEISLTNGEELRIPRTGAFKVTFA